MFKGWIPQQQDRHWSKTQTRNNSVVGKISAARTIISNPRVSLSWSECFDSQWSNHACILYFDKTDIIQYDWIISNKLTMPLAGLDKLQGQLATQIVHFFGLQRVKDIFVTKVPVIQRFAFLAHSCSLWFTLPLWLWLTLTIPVSL